MSVTFRRIGRKVPNSSEQAVEPGLTACGELTRVAAKALKENSERHISKMHPPSRESMAGPNIDHRSGCDADLAASFWVVI